jgi:hypothetical protein
MRHILEFSRIPILFFYVNSTKRTESDFIGDSILNTKYNSSLRIHLEFPQIPILIAWPNSRFF